MCSPILKICQATPPNFGNWHSLSLSICCFASVTFASMSHTSPVLLDTSVDRAGPYIVFLSKKSDEAELAFECRRKGFLVGGFLKSKDGTGCILSMSPKLVVKLALECNLPLQSLQEYSNLERLTLASKAIKIIERAKAIDAEDVWVSHEKDMLRDIDESKGDTHLEHIKHYYGSKIAMYFGWLAFYTKILAIPSIAGGLLFCHQLYLQDVDSMWVPFFCVLISLWSTYFLEFWKRRGNELSFNWKVYGVEDADAEQDMAKSATRADDGVALRQMMSFTTVLSLMYVMVRVMLYFKNMQHHATEIYGADSYYKYYPTILYSILPAVATMAFEPIAHQLNKFEGHTTKTDEENSLILKHFALEFVNRYCALFHAAFWLKDLGVLRSLLISLLTINAVLNNAIEIGMPILKSYYNRWANRKKDKKTGKSLCLSEKVSLKLETTSPAPDDTHAHEHEQADPRTAALKAILEEELSKTEYDLNADYLEIVIQYGYVTMFVVAFPLAPALALLNNLFEAKVDLFKLTECRRPTLKQRSNIGSWQSCMEFVSFLSVITNCYLIVMVSTHFEMIVPSDLAPYMVSESGRLVAMMVMEHVLLGFKVMMMYVIDDVPRWIREAIAQKNALEREAAAKARLTKYSAGDDNFEAGAADSTFMTSTRSAPTKEQSANFRRKQSSSTMKDGGDEASISTIGASEPPSPHHPTSFLSRFASRGQSMSSTVSHAQAPSPLNLPPDAPALSRTGSAYRMTAPASNTSSDFVDSPLDTAEVEGSTAVTKLSPVDRLVKETTSPFGFDPAQMMILICLPLALNYFQITPWLYIPIAVLFFGYLQTKKDRIDRKMAMGIVSDPTLLKLILEEMPSWPTASEFQQMEWVNFMMQKFWPMLAIVGEQKAVRIGQPILTRMKPSFLSELTIKRFSFGTIPPRFLGIRMHQTRDEEGVIRCDLEMRYAGDPQIIIQVGPTEVEILNLRISCIMRCEMLEFCPKMTPFKLASATMMKKPFVDFNIKVAGMDIMGTKAMTGLVHSIFHKVLHSVAMYPHKIFVPMGDPDDKVDIEKLKVLNPVGILYLTLERGVDLIQANVFGSDPYVDIETIDQDIRSEIIYNTVNPEWNESYDIVVYDRGSQVISFTVFDFDMTNNTKCLGKAEFEVNKVPYNTRVQKTLHLTGVDKGSIVVSCMYIPMASGRKASEKSKHTRIPRSVFKGERTAADDQEEGENDVLFDLPMEELTTDDQLVSGDLALQTADNEPEYQQALAQAGLGILTISHIHLRNLKVGAVGNWKPCVSFLVGTSKKQTRSKKNIVNPEFEERFAFVIKDQTMMERIMVKVLDKKKMLTGSRQVGEAVVSLYDLLNMGSNGQAATIEKEYKVESEQVDCMVGFKMQWFSTSAVHPR